MYPWFWVCLFDVYIPRCRYASYFALFLHFAVMSYCTKKRSGKEKGKKKESTSNPAAAGTPPKAQTPQGKASFRAIPSLILTFRDVERDCVRLHSRRR